MERLALPCGQVHVWEISLRPDAGRPENTLRLLTSDELHRAERFSIEAERWRFVLSRAALRAILARYLDQPPRALRFDYGARGKPRLAGSPVQFNLAHAHEIALCAVARDREVGVDVEYVRPVRFAERLARRYFSESAQRGLVAFFSEWTRREACAKASGRGVLQLLEPRDTRAWKVREMTPRDGYVAAVAAAGHTWRLRFLRWRA
jgi:4'-phosphopantetheinyl transferase